MDFLLNLLPSLQHFGMWGYWFVFLVALLEGVAFLGSFIPGATVVVLAGIVSSQGYLDIGDLIWFAAIGAAIGDCFSYYLGTKGARFFRDGNKLLRREHLVKLEQFFGRFGNASVVIGRFTPLRALIPFFAGLSKMRARIFITWDLASALAWSASHLLLGFLFGETFFLLEHRLRRVALRAVLFGGLIFAIWYTWRHWSETKLFFRSIARMFSSLWKGKKETKTTPE